MKKVYQRITNSIIGDCLKCCVASLLELEYEDVPNFIEYENGNWLVAMKVFLKERGIYPILLQRENFLHQEVNYIAIGESPRALQGKGFSHSVIMNGNTLAHDPHPDNKGVGKLNYIILFQLFDYKIRL